MIKRVYIWINNSRENPKWFCPLVKRWSVSWKPQYKDVGSLKTHNLYCVPYVHQCKFTMHTNGNGILIIFTLWTRWTWFDLTHITIVLPLCRTSLRSRFKVLPAVYTNGLLIFIRIIKMLIWPRLNLTNCCYIDFIQPTELIYHNGI